jgi:hypothetical protein
MNLYLFLLVAILLTVSFYNILHDFIPFFQVLEPRFCAELFAQLLSIPANKTLLRRHLNTHFIALVGNDTQHKKREHESQPSYIPLLPNAKVKVS